MHVCWSSGQTATDLLLCVMVCGCLDSPRVTRHSMRFKQRCPDEVRDAIG